MTTHAPDATDRSPAAPRLAELSGLDVLRAMGRGEIPMPPAAHLLGIEGVSAERGHVVFAMPATQRHYNPLGVVHGGILTTLLDTAMGCAVYSTLPPGESYTTLELKVNFVRAVTEASGRLSAEGRLVHEGRSTAVAEARLTDAAGRLVAHATTTCILFRAAAGDAAGADRSRP